MQFMRSSPIVPSFVKRKLVLRAGHYLALTCISGVATSSSQDIRVCDETGISLAYNIARPKREELNGYERC